MVFRRQTGVAYVCTRAREARGRIQQCSTCSFINSTGSDRFFSLSRPHAHHLPVLRSPFPLPPNATCPAAHRAARPAAQTDYLTPSAALAPSVICFVRDWWHVRQQASKGKGTGASSRGEGKADDSPLDPFPCRRAFSIAALRLGNQRGHGATFVPSIDKIKSYLHGLALCVDVSLPGQLSVCGLLIEPDKTVDEVLRLVFDQCGVQVQFASPSAKRGVDGRRIEDDGGGDMKTEEVPASAGTCYGLFLLGTGNAADVAEDGIGGLDSMMISTGLPLNGSHVLSKTYATLCPGVGLDSEGVMRAQLALRRKHVFCIHGSCDVDERLTQFAYLQLLDDFTSGRIAPTSDEGILAALALAWYVDRQGKMPLPSDPWIQVPERLLPSGKWPGTGTRPGMVTLTSQLLAECEQMEITNVKDAMEYFCELQKVRRRAGCSVARSCVCVFRVCCDEACCGIRHVI